MDREYRAQVSLLVRSLPHLGTAGPFALKGGTAINLFVRDLPRLSVDIDLVYLPIQDRASSLNGIAQALEAMAQGIERGVPGTSVVRVRAGKEQALTKLLVRDAQAQIKIEVTPVLRGASHKPVLRTVAPRVEEEFGFAEVLGVSDADLWAGKLVAALDRQHPRDLFDARGLLENEGLTGEIREAFVVYLLSHDRPTHEVLAVTPKDLSKEYASGFVGMTTDPVPLEALLEVRERLKAELVAGMPEAHRAVLVGFQRGEVDWDALPGIPRARDMPAVLWKARNLATLSPERRGDLARGVEDVFGIPTSTTPEGASREPRGRRADRTQ